MNIWPDRSMFLPSRWMVLTAAVALQSLAVTAAVAAAEPLNQDLKRRSAETAVAIAACLEEQKVISPDQTAPMSFALAKNQGLSSDELKAFVKEPGFAERAQQLIPKNGGCKKIAEDIKAALAKDMTDQR